MNELSYPFEPGLLLKKKKIIKQELLARGDNRLVKKVAVLGGSTTADIVAVLELFLLNCGIQPTIYESDYGQWWQDGMFGSDLRKFAPDVIYIHTTNRNVAQYPDIRHSQDEIRNMQDDEFGRFCVLWEKLREDLNCPIIQNNFEPPFFRLMGNKDVSDVHGWGHYLNVLNQQFYQYAQGREGFYINDISYLAGEFGLSRWHDLRMWHMYKYALALEAIPGLSFSVANIIKSLYGKNKKALVLDLDNTLWGGVIGDDGVDGIDLEPRGVYQEFQEYVKAHKDLGVVLNIASKNEHENAVAGLNHPSSCLASDDFVIIKANWNNKDQNVSAIAQELNIGTDSLVFVDDNPAERGFISQQMPEVAVPLMDNAENYIKAIDRAGYFETTVLSTDDLIRSDMYKENIQRSESRQAFVSYHDYLLSLKMEASIIPFQSSDLQRITQLANKTNQFNLTTRRYTESEIQAVYHDDNYIKVSGRLTDCFGDNGLVSVIIGRKQGRDLHLELWIMSCRVLKRDMEFAMLDQLVEVAQSAGIYRLVGYYYPTPKNAIVKNFYADMGFELIGEDGEGTQWRLGLNGYDSKNKVIGRLA